MYIPDIKLSTSPKAVKEYHPIKEQILVLKPK